MLRPGHACRRTLAVPALCAASNCVTMQQLAAECWLWLPCFLLRTCLCLTTGTAVWAGSPQVSASSGMHLHAVGWYWLPLPATVCLPGCPAGKGVRAWVSLGDGQQWHASGAASSDASPGSPSRRLQKARQVRVTMGNKQMMRDEEVAISQAVDDYMREMEVGT